MESSLPSPIQTWMEHIAHLAGKIGPRGSTTPGERLGAEYCQQVLTRLGYQASLDEFSSARSIFEPHLLASIALIAAFVIYPLAGTLSAAVAALLSAHALASDLLELSFINNPLRALVHKGKSQNVVAVVEPAGEHHQDLVLIGHIDSQRTPLIFRSQKWVDAYTLFTTIAFIAFAGQVILYFLGLLFGWPWVWPFSVVCLVCSLLLAALCIQADLTPFTAGANDNASAVGLVLTLAESFKTAPLQHTRVWLVCTGCEEVQHYGAIDFFARYKDRLKSPTAIAFEMMGCSGPAWLTREGIVIPFYANPALVRLAERIGRENPQLKAYPTQISGGNTEMADALRNKIPAITLTGMTRTGSAPYWHQVGDTPDKIDPEILGRALVFTNLFIRAVDENKE
jgi:hypothetical protein